MKYYNLKNRNKTMTRSRRKNYKRQPLVQEYFKKHHYGHGDSHKEDNARYKIYQVFDKWYFNRTSIKDLGTHYAPIDRYEYKESFPFDLDGLIIDLEKILPELNYLRGSLYRQNLKDYRKGLELALAPDTRRGWETYGFKDLESVQYNLSYISDRWYCEFRLQWMIDLVHWYNVKKAVMPTYKKEK